MKKYISIVVAMLFLTVVIGYVENWYALILEWLVSFGAGWIIWNYIKTNKKVAIVFVVVIIFFNPLKAIYCADIARILSLITGIIFLPFDLDRFYPIVMKLKGEKVDLESDENNSMESADTNEEENLNSNAEPEQQN